MERENLHTPFTIVYETLDEYPRAVHRHSFFELIYIISGKGRQYLNQSHFNYSDGQMFLITPDDTHGFEIETRTTFFNLRFNNIYIKESGIANGNIRQLEYILQNANHKPGCILRNVVDKQ